jgi:hypothetical protein
MPVPVQGESSDLGGKGLMFRGGKRSHPLAALPIGHA